jgi:hypothetical protein
VNEELDRPNRIGVIAVAIILFCLLGIAGHVEYEDEMKQEAFYCDMVKQGHWPNYKELVCPLSR